jgi:predicted O-linked N-acetylglucosamine transferase (SPINDLY family)
VYALTPEREVDSAALTVQGSPLPSGRLSYDRKGMILHAVMNAMNHSRNHFARGVLLDLIAERPDLAKAHAFLGSVLGRLGDAEAAIPLHERAVEMDPTDISLHHTLIFALDQSAEVSLERAYQARRAFNEQVKVDPATIAPHANDRDPERKLRVGYVSADFKNHSAAYGWAPVLLAHNRVGFELYAYSCTAEEDARTQDIKSAVEHWRDASIWDDDRLEQQIRADQIDILVDLSGHSGGNRLEVFARKPAPVQVTAWGYITGTGLDAMDYIFADDVTITPDEEQWYAEEVIRLNRILTCWAPDRSAVGNVQPPPCDTNGHLTFGVFNRLGKIQMPCVRAWAEILQRVPDARLIVKSPGLDDPDARLALEAMFVQAGYPMDEQPIRLEWRGMTNQNEHLRTYHLIDVCLDTSPHGGGMSALDATWMGVPTLTLPHIQIPSRIATTINRELGLNFLVAESWPDYVARAVALNDQRDELRKVRALAHDMVTVSAFGDHLGYARGVEEKFRWMWQRWCEGWVKQARDNTSSGLRVVN